MFERTAPQVLLVGDWPPTDPEHTWFPVSEPRLWRLSNEAFRLYSLLLSVAYAGDFDSLSGLLRQAKLPDEIVGKALAELVPTGLVIIVPGLGDDGEIAELHLVAPR